MKTIIIDTNFLLLPFTKRVDIFSEIKRIMNEPFEVCITKEIMDELKNIIEHQSGKDKDAAIMAIQLLDKLKIPQIKQKDLKMSLNSRSVDDILLQMADESTIIATNDKAFKQKLTEKKIKIIELKGKQLELKNVL